MLSSHPGVSIRTCWPRLLVLVAGLLLMGCVLVDPCGAEEGGRARTILLPLHNLEVAKQGYRQGNPILVDEVARVVSVAERQLSTGPFSVTFTPEIPPSGDKHDLVSYGFYTWPNPDTPDGLPWIYRDGHGNPDNEVDWKQVLGISHAANALGLAYYFTDDERYASRMAELLRIFFLDESTRMNPRIEFSDMVPGVSPGSYGVPGLGNMLASYRLFEAAGILEKSPAWTVQDRQGLQAWAKELVRWSEVNPKGIRQWEEPSNHGTNYDFVNVLLSLYAEDLPTAEKHYRYFIEDRMPNQIAADGANPLEMLRANNLLYHRYNLSRSLDIAALGMKLDSIDLLEYQTPAGVGLRDSLEFLLPYFLREAIWDRWPGESFSLESPLVHYELIRRAASLYKDPQLLEVANRLGRSPANFIDLTYPEAIVYEGFLAGDANLDGRFTSADMLLAFQHGKYETTQSATWLQGDWNLDRRFDTRDLVLAMQQSFHAWEASDVSAPSVPEPASASLLLFGMLQVAGKIRVPRKRRAK